MARTAGRRRCPKPPLTLQLSLQFADARHRALLPRHRVQRWMRAALEAPAQITVRIVDEDERPALNRDYRGKDYATNVLTEEDEAEAERMEAREREILAELGFPDPYA
jgi:ssRNA-specific RNase YbeY (16S rRNA maturation enzyme)